MVPNSLIPTRIAIANLSLRYRTHPGRTTGPHLLPFHLEFWLANHLIGISQCRRTYPFPGQQRRQSTLQPSAIKLLVVSIYLSLRSSVHPLTRLKCPSLQSCLGLQLQRHQLQRDPPCLPFHCCLHNPCPFLEVRLPSILRVDFPILVFDPVCLNVLDVIVVMNHSSDCYSHVVYGFLHVDYLRSSPFRCRC